jgi:hypothetical protein
MRAEPVGALDNDAAAEWLQFLLNDADDTWPVDDAIEAVGSAQGRSDLEACQRAMAAAELVATAGGKPRPGLAAEVVAWVEPRWPELWHGKRASALAVVKKMLASSAMLEHWRENGNAAAWLRDVEDLRDRLS